MDNILNVSAAKYLGVINLTNFYEGFFFIFKADKLAHSKLRNNLCNAEDEKKDQ